MISVWRINEVEGTGRFELEEENMIIFEEYAKFVNLRKIDEHEFFACAYWDLLILRYEDGVLFTCHVFTDLHAGMIFDVSIFGSSVFTVSEGKDNLCKRIEFKKE
jgi:hypothetical protein